MPRRSTKTLPLTFLALTMVLLAGCAEAETGPQATTAPSATVEQPTTRPDQRRVKAVEVTDPMTIVVTPYDDTDSLFGAEFTVHVNGFLAPVKGECGSEEALAFAEETLVGKVWSILYSDVNEGAWIDAEGDHYGSLSSTGSDYDKKMIQAGLAYVTDDPGLTGLQQDTQSVGTGLWTTCPNFGA